MDPDLVRQQEEAEREALALLAKKQPANTQEIRRPETTVIPFAAPFSGAATLAASDAETDRFAPPAHEPSGAAAQPDIATLAKEAAFTRFGRFLSYGTAGGMLGGGLGVAAYHYWRVPLEQANLAIFGPAGSLAVFCAFASLFVRPPLPSNRSGEAQVYS